MATRPVNKVFANPAKLQKLADEYISSCFQDMNDEKNQVTLKNGERRSYGKRPTIIGFCNYIGIDKSSYYRYMNDDIPKGTLTEDDMNAIRETLSHVRSICEEILLQEALTGKVDTRTASLILSQYGYSTKQEIDARTTVRFIGMTDDELNQYMK